MKAFFLRLAFMTAAVSSLAAVAPALGAAQPMVVDVALGERGTVVGQVVDSQGVGVAERRVVLWQGSRAIASATSDARGYFDLEAGQAGVYQLAAGDSAVVVRVWAAGTAPPVAQRGVLLVSGHEVYRGQQSVRSVRNFLAHPVTVVGVVATGIAVPVALHHSRRRGPISPN